MLKFNELYPNLCVNQENSQMKNFWRGSRFRSFGHVKHKRQRQDIADNKDFDVCADEFYKMVYPNLEEELQEELYIKVYYISNEYNRNAGLTVDRCGSIYIAIPLLDAALPLKSIMKNGSMRNFWR